MKLLKQLMETQQPVIYLAIGASGSGKSTYLKKLKKTNPDIQSFSFDDLRHQWYDKDNYARAWTLSTQDKDFNKKAYDVFREMIKSRADIYVDNTNLTVKLRAFYIDLARKNGYKVVGIEMPVPDVELLISRQKTRGDKNVKADAVRDQFSRLEPPRAGEFDEVIVSDHNMNT